MSNKRILIFGHDGQLAWELQRTFAPLGHVVSLSSKQADFSSPEKLRAIVREQRPDIILNASAYTAVDKAESEPELASTINGTAPGILADEARRAKAIFVHYSTDYVFDGSKMSAYTEFDKPHPISTYGWTKLAGDEAVQSAGGEHLVLRTSWVYSTRGSNFLLTMLRMAAEGRALQVVNDQFGAPTSAASLARATASLLALPLAQPMNSLNGKGGVYNLCNAGATSWYDFACDIFELAHKLAGRPKPSITHVPSSAFIRPAKRPRNSQLSLNRIEQVFGLKMPHWHDALESVMRELFATSGERFHLRVA